MTVRVSDLFFRPLSHSAHFLTNAERAVVIRRLQADDQFSAAGEAFTVASLKSSFTDWRMWCGCVMYMGVDGP